MTQTDRKRTSTPGTMSTVGTGARRSVVLRALLPELVSAAGLPFVIPIALDRVYKVI